ncbi:MAG: hypothetical protein KDM91_07515 [Verrucomicrobiae bacterium]|nr:hypothetical protein [Verrucomicrobiae bacterium]
MTIDPQLRPRTVAIVGLLAMALPLAAYVSLERLGFVSRRESPQLGATFRDSGDPPAGAEKAVTLRSEAIEEASNPDGDGEGDEKILAGAEAALLNRLGVDVSAAEGSGGEGIHRSVRHRGVWFPVFAPGRAGADADTDESGKNEPSLYIASPSPPRYRVGEEIGYRFEAVGGAPPYEWRIEPGLDGFAIDSGTGWFSGKSDTPLAAPLGVFVRDAAGAEDSATYTLVIDEGEPLEIVTDDIPAGAVGADYTVELAARGGLSPYRWEAPEGLPSGFSLEAESGHLSGRVEDAGLDGEIAIRVTDAGGGEAARRFRLRIDSAIEIVTERDLPPAAPGAPYRREFQAEGGVPPYEWRLVEGSLPIGDGGLPWTLSIDGILEGVAPRIESSHWFALEATDSAGNSARKEFALPVRQTLIVVPSREKAGLAWSMRDLHRFFGGAVAGVTVTRSTSPEPDAPAAIVYQGGGDNFVDRGLATGATYFYTLHVHSPAAAEPVAFARNSARILPFTKSRGQPGVTADPYADAVKIFRPLASGAYGAAFAPGNVTGPPDGAGTFSPAWRESEVLSLHARDADFALPPDAAGGSIVLSFEDNIVEFGPGEDLTIFENVFFIGGDPNRRFMEPAVVSVALFEGEWIRFPIDVVPPAGVSSTPATMDPFYYNRGFAGRNATTGDDPTDPARSGGDAFDLDRLPVSGLSWIRYVRLQSTGHSAWRDDVGGDPVEHIADFGALSGSGGSGFDLDAVAAIHP